MKVKPNLDTPMGRLAHESIQRSLAEGRTVFLSCAGIDGPMLLWELLFTCTEHNLSAGTIHFHGDLLMRPWAVSVVCEGSVPNAA